MPHASSLQRTSFTITALLLASCICALFAPAQTLSPGEVRLSSRPYQPRPILRSESRLVELEVVVRDGHGRAIPGLAKDDFAVYDSGKNRELTAFSVELSNPGVHAASLSDNSPSHTPSGTAQPLDPEQPKSLAPSAAARWIAIHFDDINTSVADLAHAKVASKRFVREAMAGGDRIGIFTTSAGRTIDFTSDTSAVLAGIAKLQSHPRMPPGGPSSCPRMAPYEAYQIVNNDPNAMKVKIMEACQCGGSDDTNSLCMSAESIQPSELLNSTFGHGSGADIIESVKAQAQQTWNLAHQLSQMTLEAIKGDIDLLAGKSGDRILLLASSGFLSGTLEEQQDAIVNAAVRGGVVINSLDAKGLYAEAPGGPINESNDLVYIPTSSTVFQIESLGDRLDDLDSAMARFAESTGGLLFRNNNDLDFGFHQLGLLPACTYLLGFTPAIDGKYHKIKVELRKASLGFVQVRPGYYAPGVAAVGQPGPAEKLDALMSSSDDKTGLPATLSEKLGSATSGAPQLNIQAHIDIQKLPFEQQKDRHVQKLIIVAALFDPQNNFVIGKQAEMQLALKPESYERFSKTGINGTMQLEVAPGNYRLRILVQEALQGAVRATSTDLYVAPPAPASLPSVSAEKKLKNRGLQWSPPALDSPLPSLESSTPCDLAAVLAQAAQRESEQVTNLQNFTAQETVQYQSFDRQGSTLDLGSETFDYIVVFQKSPGGLIFQEKRNPTHGSSLSAVATQDVGLPEIVLVFLPNMQQDYEMSCEGAVESGGQPTWLVRFQQRKDKPSRTYSFRVDNIVYPARLKGRAWIAADTGEVVRMETALMEAVPVVGVQHSYLSIDYAPVQFQSQPLRTWLPKVVEGYWDFGGHRTIVYHTFSDFLLFSVQTDQKIEKPKQP